MPLMFLGNSVLFSGGSVAMDPSCCCEPLGGCCAPRKALSPTLYGILCLNYCNCEPGVPAEILFTLTYNASNDRWEGSISFPGCSKTMQVRVTCREEDADNNYFTWSDDACDNSWRSKFVDDNLCRDCDPYLFNVAFSTPSYPITGCCPDHEPLLYPEAVAYVFCDENVTCEP